MYLNKVIKLLIPRNTLSSTVKTQTVAQQPGGTSPGLPGWLLPEVPLLGSSGLGLVLAALITALIPGFIQLYINARNRKHAEKLERISKSSQRSCEKNRLKLIKFWKDCLDDRSDILGLTNNSCFKDLDSSLSQSAREELSRLIYEYKEKCKQFLEIDLPKIKQDARIYAAEEKIIDMVTSSVSEKSEAKRLMRSLFIQGEIDEAKERLGEPLRNFLHEQIVDLQKRWELL